MKRVAIDVGYGFVKVVAEGGWRALFPSVVARARGQGDLAVALGGGGLRHRVEVEWTAGEAGAQAWWVGEAALAAGGARGWETAGSERAGYDVLTLAGLRCVGGEGPVELAAGLPLAVWLDKPERNALRRRLEALSAWVSVDGGEARLVEVRSAVVLPQALGAAVAALGGPDAERLEGRDIGVVDVGYRTTDLLLLLRSAEGVAVPDEDRSGSVDVGISQAYAEVAAEVGRDTGGMVPQGVVERALAQGGVLAVRGRDRDLRESFERACVALAAEVEAHVRRVWRDRLDFLSAVVVTGGGGAALARHLRLPVVTVSQDPVFANAIGFLAALEAAPAARGAPTRA